MKRPRSPSVEDLRFKKEDHIPLFFKYSTPVFVHKTEEQVSRKPHSGSSHLVRSLNHVLDLLSQLLWRLL